MKQLNVLDEQGNIVGQASRGDIHRQGLLHAEVHVWFYTPQGTIVFQHRAKNKDTFPDLLDATVGGHVEIGDTFESAALTETQEETGLMITPTDLVEIALEKFKLFDPASNTYNYALDKMFAYRYEGTLSGLRVEEGKGEGFEEWSLEDLLDPRFVYKDKFIPRWFEPEYAKIFRAIKKLL